MPCSSHRSGKQLESDLCDAVLKLLNPQTSADETTTEALLRAQVELSTGHEFTETLLYRNRNVISSYIELVSSMLLDSFMDTYSEIHIIQE